MLAALWTILHLHAQTFLNAVTTKAVQALHHDLCLFQNTQTHGACKLCIDLAAGDSNSPVACVLGNKEAH